MYIIRGKKHQEGLVEGYGSHCYGQEKLCGHYSHQPPYVKSPLKNVGRMPDRRPHHKTSS